MFSLRLAALNDTICLLRAIVHSEQLHPLLLLTGVRFAGAVLNLTKINK